MKQRIICLVLANLLCLALIAPTTATGPQSERDLAAEYLRQHQIMVGDADGNMHLDRGLNRAELAVLLTRLHGGLSTDASSFSGKCYFTDVPNWAKPYVGYCAANYLVSGYGGSIYGSYDLVTPQMACAVVLRAFGDTTGWTYSTVCSYVVSRGLLDSATVQADTITRGEIAILIYRASGSPAANNEPITEESVLERLRQIERNWPTGTVWGTHNTPGTHKNEAASTESGRIMQRYRVSNTYGCGAYASMVSSLIFGDTANPGRQLEDIREIRPGDIVFVVSPEGKVAHVVVALESPNAEGRFHYTDGNHGETITWPSPEHPDLRSYSLTGFSGRIPHHLEVWTRYPANVPFTGNSVEAWPK